MKVFLKMVKVFPRDIIFNRQRRLDDEGYRWAPTSFLGIPQLVFVRGVEGEPTIVAKNGPGLLVTGAGFVLTISESSPTGLQSPLFVTVPLNNQQDLELMITLIPLAGSLVPFQWVEGAKYGVILSHSMVDIARDYS